ncbi:uncharacterized protein LOC109856087 [Pseudomyrmex gracilis]|uniref:uncharacterized protein LOC109856087 n=1 Tax=Pseudomyrmex gracilis TaxID=219809 RepID=UPI000994D44E|nr:uncharacterized protein LOC109856087 [Pseudomyrmex gracilis]XP_020286576.1 uncharacterized protein LOC109856087 [Pseudomyrmex gracilis]XP_020286587.1 uncharacterized protein LOC109856087 [Pseudomyrmex gracilis]
MRHDKNPKSSSSGFTYFENSQSSSSQVRNASGFGQSTPGFNTNYPHFGSSSNMFGISASTNTSGIKTTQTTINTIPNIVTTSTSSFGSAFGSLGGTSTSTETAFLASSTNQVATTSIFQNTCSTLPTNTNNTNLFSTSSSPLPGKPLYSHPFGINSNGFKIPSFNPADIPTGLTVNEAIEKTTNTEQKSVENKIIPLQSHIPLINVSYCKTFLKSEKYKFTWKLERFKEIHRLEDTLIAENSEESESHPYTIHMKVFRASDDNLHDNHKNNTSLLKDKIAFYILPAVTFKCTFTVNVIKDSKFIQCKVASGTGSISKSKETLLYETTAEELYKMLYKENTLLIEFIFEVYRKCSLNTTYSSEFKEDSNLKSKDLNFDKYCNSDDKQSIKFIINENDYIVPITQLLATNSRYFEEICNNKEKEKDITDEIISDRKQEIFMIMISFIKTGLIPAIIEVNDLKDLLRLAYKFDVQTLKLICEECLLSYITLSTAIDFMQLATSCNAKCLEKNVENFLKIHIQDIISLKEFHLLSPEHLQKIIKIKEEAENNV